ncbi:hypothetical protein BGZ49_006891 [Haplosporangium sp. Z 27]|nr:hypothetical protein BGZ49_006891 [Haplosporangium sp. Z 27]
MNSTRPSQRQKQHSLSLRSTVLIFIFSSCWAYVASANLTCTSPTTSIIQPGTPLSLGFSGTGVDSALSNIAADLICSSTGKKVLSLGSGYDSTSFSPNSPKTTITVSQATAATTSCPSNVFHIQYTASSLLSKEVVPCNENLSIASVNMALLPSLSSLTLPIPIIPTTSILPSTSAASSSGTATSQPPIQTTVASSSITTSIATTTAIATLTSVHTKPSQHSSQPAIPPTTSTSAGGSKGNGGGNGGSATSSDGATAPSSSIGSSSSSMTDFQSSNSSSPSTAVIAGGSVGVVAAIFVTLAGILIWRKKQQRKMNLDDLFMGDSSLAAASGFSKPIYARSDPDEDRHHAREGSVVVPMGTAHSRAGSPPPLMPAQPYPAAISMGQQDMGFYNDADNSDYPVHRQPSYRLPYNHSGYDYNSHNHRHHG